MAYRSLQLTLNGTPQRLDTAWPKSAAPLAGAAPGSEPQNDDPALCQLQVQNASNANVVYFGGDNTVSATNFGQKLVTVGASTPYDQLSLGPFDAGHFKPSGIWVLGTNNDKLNIIAIEY